MAANAKVRPVPGPDVLALVTARRALLASVTLCSRASVVVPAMRSARVAVGLVAAVLAVATWPLAATGQTMPPPEEYQRLFEPVEGITIPDPPESHVVAGWLDGWGVFRPQLARTDSGWIHLEPGAYRSAMPRGVTFDQQAEPWGGLRWRLLPDDGPAREIRSGHLVRFDDTYFGAWGLLTDQRATAVAPNSHPGVVGAVVTPWVPVRQIEPVDLDDPALDSINLRLAPSKVDRAIRITGPGGTRWTYYRASWTPPDQGCSMARAEGWIREGDYDAPQQAWTSEGECDVGGKGDVWATPMAVIDEAEEDLVLVLLQGWEYLDLGLRRLTPDSVGPVIPRGW